MVTDGTEWRILPDICLLRPEKYDHEVVVSVAILSFEVNCRLTFPVIFIFISVYN